MVMLLIQPNNYGIVCNERETTVSAIVVPLGIFRLEEGHINEVYNLYWFKPEFFGIEFDLIFLYFKEYVQLKKIL